MRWIQLILLIGLLAGPVESQNHVVTHGITEERVAGLLDLPEILDESDCKEIQPKSLAFYPSPSKDQPPAGLIEVRSSRSADVPDCYLLQVIVRRSGDNFSNEALPLEETGYERPAAVVYERRGTWFRIALERGSAWIEPDGAGDFLSYPDGLSSDTHLTYLREGWDGLIWSAPGISPPAPAPRGFQSHRGRSLPIHVLSTRTIGAEVWVHIRFETEEVCGQTLDGLTPLEGWVPAYRSRGETSVWFHSRGC